MTNNNFCRAQIGGAETLLVFQNEGQQQFGRVEENVSLDFPPVQPPLSSQKTNRKVIDSRKNNMMGANTCTNRPSPWLVFVGKRSTKASL